MRPLGATVKPPAERKVPQVLPVTVPVIKSGCPTTTSAGWSLPVGRVFQIKTLLLVESTTNNRPLLTTKPLGPFSVEADAVPPWFAVLLTKSGCPRTMSAGVLLVVGKWL